MASLSNCAAWMKAALGFEVGSVSFFSGIKHPQMGSFASKANVGKPFFALIVPVGSDQARCLAVASCSLDILFVHGARNVTQIAYSVIRSVAIYMVDMLRRPIPVHIQPSQSMRAMKFSINRHCAVALMVSMPSYFSKLRRPPSSHQPSENPSFWVVVKKFAQTLRGKIGSSHETLQSLIGQRPTRVRARGGRRYFSLEVA